MLTLLVDALEVFLEEEHRVLGFVDAQTDDRLLHQLLNIVALNVGLALCQLRLFASAGGHCACKNP